MTIEESVRQFADLAVAKAKHLSKDPLAFAVSSLMAGAYVGLGIILIFSVGQAAPEEFRGLLMGMSFGIALTLVVFAGSDLFTGHTMYMTFGRLTGASSTGDLFKCWGATWSGNLVGSVLLGILFVTGGGGIVLQAGGADLLHAVAYKKMSGTPIELIARGMLCNWLVCLALWAGARTKDDTAKCIIIFWCLFAFITAGFEHSVANMTVFSIALLSEHGPEVTVGGAAYNLLWVTIGNTLSGVIIMGVGYWVIAGRPRDLGEDTSE